MPIAIIGYSSILKTKLVTTDDKRTSPRLKRLFKIRSVASNSSGDLIASITRNEFPVLSSSNWTFWFGESEKYATSEADVKPDPKSKAIIATK